MDFYSNCPYLPPSMCMCVHVCLYAYVYVCTYVSMYVYPQRNIDREVEVKRRIKPRNETAMNYLYANWNEGPLAKRWLYKLQI